ncbi:MAG: PspC domain-containing protein [Acidobacteriota bacterium]|nr:PspC domain-containing protein [Acidobacteriota bacterium]
MYCSSCGVEVSDAARYCPQCGIATSRNSFVSPSGKPAHALSRPREDRKIAGVCAGIARYMGIDVTLVRILTLVFVIWPPGVGLIFYLVCWIVMPQDLLMLPPASQTSQPGNLAVS